jgi:hypothetical protein
VRILLLFAVVPACLLAGCTSSICVDGEAVQPGAGGPAATESLGRFGVRTRSFDPFLSAASSHPALLDSAVLAARLSGAALPGAAVSSLTNAPTADQRAALQAAWAGLLQQDQAFANHRVALLDLGQTLVASLDGTATGAERADATRTVLDAWLARQPAILGGASGSTGGSGSSGSATTGASDGGAGTDASGGTGVGESSGTPTTLPPPEVTGHAKPQYLARALPPPLVTTLPSR